MHFWVCRSLENFESLNNRANMAGRKRKILTLQERVKVVDRLEKGESARMIANSTNQSSPPGTVPSFPSITQSRNDVDSCVNAVRSLAKTRPSPLVVETEVPISRGAFGVLSTVVPPSGKIQPIRAVLPACRRRSPSRSYKRAATVPLP